jgi:hypothetical protein
MPKTSLFSIAMIGSLVFAVIVLTHAPLKHPPYAPQVHTEQQAMGALESRQDAKRSAEGSAKTDEEHSGKHSEQGDDQGTEFWPAVFGIRVKITDSLLAVFTLGLLIFTALLWLSTDKLWKAGERQLALAQSSSERQLRAYLYIEKIPVKRHGDTFRVAFWIKNFGQTPAHNAKVEYVFEIVDCVDKKPTEIPVATDTASLGSIAPLTDSYELDDQLTGVDLLSIQSGDKAIYLTGSITYDTEFSQGRVTNFRYLIGGEIGWEGDDEMSADDSGNDAT